MKELRSDNLSKEYEDMLKRLEVTKRKENGILEEKVRYLKQAAEIAFAIAMESLEEESEDLETATKYVDKSIMLYKELNAQTEEDAAPYYMRINKVEIPDLMHELVVIDRYNLKMNWSL